MIASDNSAFLNEQIALARSKPRSPLEQSFYTNPDFHRADMRAVFEKQWLMVDHVSRIPEKGQFFLFEIGNESIIIIREDGDAINAFFNVCRHRGSRVCLEKEGKTGRITCPYHAWTYNLDGSLRGARLMPVDFDKSHYGLKTCHLVVFEGLIFINLSPDTPPDFHASYDNLQPFLRQQGIERARVAVRRNYPNQANWKLVVENFIECYHCAPAHREYSSVHPQEKLLAFGAGPGSGSEEDIRLFQPKLDAWETRTRAMGHLTGMLDGGPDSLGMHQAARLPIDPDRGLLSETTDGSPACSRLMGTFKARDEGQTAIAFNPFSYILASNDFAVMLRWTPRDALNTDVELVWLVDRDAVEGEDYDPAVISRVWDITIRQDKKITEDNQAGIASSRYEPGPYSNQEARNVAFKQWYLKQLETAL